MQEKTASASGSDNHDSVEGNREQTSDSVAYETHRKLLGERKKDREKLSQMQEELARYQALERQKEEREAEANGEWDKLKRTYQEQIQDLQGKVTNYERSMVEGRKLQSFMEKVPGTIPKREYLSFVDTDEIILDPETGEVDEMSLEKTVNSFVQEYPHLIVPKDSKKNPSYAKLGPIDHKKSVKDLTIEELRSLHAKTVR